MAILQATVFSKSLMRNVPLTVILPVDKLMASAKKEYPTLYLLHGIYGNTLDWLTNTRINRWAMERDLCVVMPSGENSYYLDDPAHFDHWSRFVGQELVELTRRMFPLSERREDTFIGGLSMGGYGALYNGLKYRETFSWILAFSPALRIRQVQNSSYESGLILSNRAFAERVFGDLDALPTSDRNPIWQVRQLAEAGGTVPSIYLACGDRDELMPGSRELDEALTACNLPHIFEILPGAHEWDFWDRALEKSLNILPLGRRKSSNR